MLTIPWGLPGIGGFTKLIDTSYSEYKEVGGIMVPHQFNVKEAGLLVMVCEITSFSPCDKLEEKDFAKPPDKASRALEPPAAGTFGARVVREGKLVPELAEQELRAVLAQTSDVVEKTGLEHEAQLRKRRESLVQILPYLGPFPEAKKAVDEAMQQALNAKDFNEESIIYGRAIENVLSRLKQATTKP